MIATVGPVPCAQARTLVTARVGRVKALDQMRGFVVGLVVLHHAMLAYCTFGHTDRVNYARSTAPIVDPQRWIGFDIAVCLNDSFFMSLLFLLSGLFVPQGLARAGAGGFLRARMIRLGLPFLVAELALIPLAYYPSYLQAGGRLGIAQFWMRTVTIGPWPSGPPWFIGILMLLDVGAALAFVLLHRGRSRTATPRAVPGTGTCFASLLAITGLLYMPLLLAVGPTRWFSIGPLAIQGSRIGLYAGYFMVDLWLGRAGGSAIVPFGQSLGRRYALWLVFAAVAGAGIITVGPLRTLLDLRTSTGSVASLILTGTALVAFCTAACFALPALFLRFGGGRSPALDSLAANSFAIFLLHYPFVTWVQYGMLTVPIGALSKAVVTLTIALTGSWIAASLLRRLPVLDRVL